MTEEVKNKETATAKAAEGVIDSKVNTPDAAVADAAVAKKIRKSKKKSVPQGKIYVNAGFNNTLVTVTDPEGNAIAWSSSGACGFKGTKKSTPYAAQMAAENAAEKAKAFGFAKADVFVKGVGSGREQALRGLIAQGIEVMKICDMTPIPHNGCKRPRPRRV